MLLDVNQMLALEDLAQTADTAAAPAA
jgi:hypothetical protein